jgi:hypothetical protein
MLVAPFWKVTAQRDGVRIIRSWAGAPSSKSQSPILEIFASTGAEMLVSVSFWLVVRSLSGC